MAPTTIDSPTPLGIQMYDGPTKGQPLDYNSLGVKNIQNLFLNMDGQKVNMTSRYTSRVLREIEEILKGSLWGIAMSDLSCIERCYQLRHHRSLDYKSVGVGVENIEGLIGELVKQKKVLLLNEPKSKETYAMSVSLAELKQKSYLKTIVKEFLHEHDGEIPLSCFENLYKDKFKLEWNPHDFGLTNLEQLSQVLRDIVTVEVNSSGDKAMKAVNEDSPGPEAVFGDIEGILDGCRRGFAMSALSRLEYEYQQAYDKPLDYKSIGVENIEDLIIELDKQKKVVFLYDPKIKERYVTSVSVAEDIRNDYLKFIVKELLDEHGGVIWLSCFEDLYKDKCNLEWNSHDFGLTDLDQLCHVLKDIVMVEVNSSGNKVMKAVTKDDSPQARVTREIQELLAKCRWGIPMSELCYSKNRYEASCNGKPLYYESFGVHNFDDLITEMGKQKKVLFLEADGQKYVMSASLAKHRQQHILKSIVKELLCEHGGEIAFDSFENLYKVKKKREWKFHEFGLINLDELCHVLNDIVTVEVNSYGKKVMKAVIKPGQAVVIREIEKILGRCPLGIAMSDLSCIEGTYQLSYGKSLDYDSFGVENIEHLIFELWDQKKVLILDKTGSEDGYVMSVGLAESQHRANLKSVVEKLLPKVGGEVALSSFVQCFQREFKVIWNRDDYGLNDLDRLCVVLKDILMVEVNSAGEKVIKLVNKDSSGQMPYNLRKRKSEI